MPTSSKPQSTSSKSQPIKGVLNKPLVKIVRQSDSPPDNFPFSANQVVEQYTAWLIKMAAEGYQYTGTMQVSVGGIYEPYLVFYLQ